MVQGWSLSNALDQKPQSTYSGLGDIELRYLDREKLWAEDFRQFAWSDKHGGYRCEPVAGVPEPEELVALNPDYASKDQFIKSYPDIPKSYIGHWFRFREKFGLDEIVKRNGRVLFVHREKFREWVFNNRSWASKKARMELNAAVSEYRYY